MDEQALKVAMSAEQKMYTALSEVMELTGELADAFQRQDQVSVQMFLGMRQEPIDRLESCKAMLERQCLQLPPEQRQILRGILQGQTPPPQAQALGELVQKNKRLLDRILEVDRRLNLRIGGEHSFYRQQPGKP
ncbi:hypothetical protein [Intestinimonas sp. MSJ-38]|uniref:hypothetical protein n=1 Tax=Intestinimonas sp. MSJ-38 TaxID=2841532 RepID=UPI001C0F72B4|nr:hypothetical protein [Intestinimonas sp. MSJ-38]MBU5432694.1 hypothetical protein [Intestinimonas sp. MSJ-38]